MNKFQFDNDDQAIDFLDDYGDFDNHDNLMISVELLKVNGYIKKSELETAREKFHKINGYYIEYTREEIKDCVNYACLLEKENKRLRDELHKN